MREWFRFGSQGRLAAAVVAVAAALVAWTASTVRAIDSTTEDDVRFALTNASAFAHNLAIGAGVTPNGAKRLEKASALLGAAAAGIAESGRYVAAYGKARKALHLLDGLGGANPPVFTFFATQAPSVCNAAKALLAAAIAEAAALHPTQAARAILAYEEGATHQTAGEWADALRAYRSGLRKVARYVGL